MLPLLALFLLIGPSLCTTTGDREELTLGTEAESWVTVNLKGLPVASIELQLQEMKRSRTRQFYGLMGKRVEGIHPIQPRERMGYQLGRIVQDLLRTRGTCRQETHHQSAELGAVTREGIQSQRGRPDSLNHQQHVSFSLGTEEDDQGQLLLLVYKHQTIPRNPNSDTLEENGPGAVIPWEMLQENLAWASLILTKGKSFDKNGEK
ncbi:hypothetical protein A6R68_16132, partial [Neotoma lepida]